MTTQEIDQLAEEAAELKWDRICAQRQWDSHTRAILLEGFIRNKGLMRELVAHARGIVEQEYL